MRLLYVFIILLLTSCTVTQNYTEFGIKTLVGNEYKSEKVNKPAYIEINKTFKFVRIKFSGKKFKYKIKSFEYTYSKKGIKSGINIVSKKGHKLNVQYNKEGWIPHADLYYKMKAGTEVLVYFNYRK